MKKFVFLLFALFALTAVASATPSLTTSESYYLELINYDSAGVTPIPPESVYVVVFDQDGDSVYSAAMDTSNAQCKGPYTRSYRSGVTVKTYTYYNTVGTLDGTTGGNGHYVVSAFVWNTTKDVSWYVTGDFYEVSTSFATFMDSTLNASRDDMSDKKITPTDTTNTGQQVYAEASPLEELIAYQGVATGTPSTTKFAATGLTQADNYWNGALVFFKNGNAQNQPRPVSDFFDTGDSITISSAWTAAPTAGDSFYIVNIAASSGGGASALDFWNVAFGTAFTAGSMGDSMNNASYMQGAASGLTATQVADTVWKSLMSARSGVAGSFGDSSRFWGRTAASALDSGIVNRIVSRSIYADQSITSSSALRDSLFAVLDTLQLHDGWVAQQTILGNTRDTANAILDTLQSHDGWVAQQTILTPVRDTVNAILDTLQLHDGWVATQTTLTSTQTVVNNVRDTVNAILDTLQLYDSWVAQQTILNNVRDTTNAVLDTLQLHDGWVATASSISTLTTTTNNVRDTVNGIMDTLQLQDDWVATGTRVWNVAWNTAFTAGTMGDSLNNATVTTGNWAAGGSGLDSATTSRILGRKIWGIAAGSGSDSSVVANRTVTGGSGLDSATTSRIIGRKVWGIAAGSGADSSLVANRTVTGGSGLDSATASRIIGRKVWGVAAGSGSDSIAYGSRWTTDPVSIPVRDTVNAILDTLQLQDGWAAQQGTLTATQTTVGAVRDTVNAILDTLQLYDAWVAQQVILGNVRDTVNAIMDTLQLQDDWVATGLRVWNIAWNTAFSAGTMGDSLNNATVTTGNWAAGGTGLDSATTSRIIGRKVWGIAAGSGSDSSLVANRTVTGGGGGLDSATTSRIIGRKVWGIAAGSGSDSTAYANRVTTDPLSIPIRDSVNAILDTLQLQDGWVAGAVTLTAVRDTVNAILDTLQLYDAWVAQQTTLSTTATVVGNARDTVNAILDTLQLQDGWGAQQSTLTAMQTVLGATRDTTNAILDSLQLQDTWVATVASITTTQTTLGQVRDSVNAILDTLQLQDNWAAQQSILINVRDSVNASLDTLQWHDNWGARQDTLMRVLADGRIAVIRWGGVPVGYDSTLTRYFPITGAANKDSAQVTAWAAGAPTLFYRERYHHSNVVTVADSLRGRPGTGGGW